MIIVGKCEIVYKSTSHEYFISSSKIHLWIYIFDMEGLTLDEIAYKIYGANNWNSILENIKISISI